MSNIVTIPTDPTQQKKVLAAVKEISNSKTRIEAENDLIKDTLQMIEDEFELPKKYMRKVANIYHKQNVSEVKAEAGDVAELYEAICE